MEQVRGVHEWIGGDKGNQVHAWTRTELSPSRARSATVEEASALGLSLLSLQHIPDAHSRSNALDDLADFIG